MIRDKIISAMEKNKDQIFYISTNEQITYGELLKQAQYNAQLLLRQGTEPVTIYGHKSIDMVISIVSCLLSKRTYIPVDTCTPLDRIRQIMTQAHSSLLLNNSSLELNEDIEICSLAELTKFQDGVQQTSANSIAYIIFTSGSTGTPKGVPISYANLENFVNWISNIPVLQGHQEMRVLNQASFSFDLSVADFYFSLTNGFTLIALDKDSQADFSSFLDVIKDEKVNMIVSTPTFLRLCLVNPDFSQANFENLKIVYLCGECLDVALAKKIFNRFPKIKLLNAYGPTEATSAVSASLITEEMLTQKLLPCGDILTSATNIKIINQEIVLSGPSVFAGYLNSARIGNSYHTGDIGYINNNQLYCLGRKDNQIKYQGYRIEIEDIENNFRQIDGVEDAYVIAKRDPLNKIKFLKAFVVLKDKTLSEVEEEITKKLPAYMIPKQIEEISGIPVNCNGKVDRKALIDD